jgi:hypothetical protein
VLRTSILVGFIDKNELQSFKACVRFRVVIDSSFSEREQTRGRKFIEGLFALEQINLYKQVMFDLFPAKKIKHYYRYHTATHLTNFEH